MKQRVEEEQLKLLKEEKERSVLILNENLTEPHWHGQIALNLVVMR